MNASCDLPRLDGALDREASDADRTWAAAHLQSCVSCSAYAERRAVLDARLAGMPREMHPSRPLWPAIDGRLARSTTDATHDNPLRLSLRVRSVAAATAWRVAAAVTLLAIGFAAGTSRQRSPGAVLGAPRPDAASPSHDPAQAAADVQRIGSAWTASLTRLARNDSASPTIARQEREVALATMRGAASELMRIAPDRPGVAAAYTAIVEEHANRGVETPASRRVAF